MLGTRGGHRIALLEPLPVMPEAMTLGYVEFAPVRVLDGIKSLSYAANMLASRLARERGFDDALLVTPHGRLLELPTASFFWVSEGAVHTPPLSEHILDSITRRIVLEVADVRETAASRGDLGAAQEAFIASSVVEVLPVGRVEEQELAGSGPGDGRDRRARAGAHRRRARRLRTSARSRSPLPGTGQIGGVPAAVVQRGAGARARQLDARARARNRRHRRARARSRVARQPAAEASRASSTSTQRIRPRPPRRPASARSRRSRGPEKPPIPATAAPLAMIAEAALDWLDTATVPPPCART